MKLQLLLFLITLASTGNAQDNPTIKNVFIITTDGFRWQEVFTGADSALLNNTRYTSSPLIANQLYWDSSTENRRKKLMPFFWNVIAQQGQLYGNRSLDNRMDMKNWYKISYPGYNEILTGYADPKFIPNTPVNNNNINILEYLNNQPAYAGKVVAFSSWNVMPFILGEKRSRLLINSGYDTLEGDKNASNQIINDVQGNVSGKTHTRYDLLTYFNAMEYVRSNHPKIMFLGLGETDEAAHSNKYDLYLQHASMVDKMIGDLWYYVQTDPFYKDNTVFIITTDHGRGRAAKSWHNHGLFTRGSGETWLALIGPGIKPSGEMKDDQQTYGNQIASTIAAFLGEKFETSNSIGKPMIMPLVKTDRSTVGVTR